MDPLVGADAGGETVRGPVEEVADSGLLAGVRRWLEEAWRHGEIVVDDDALETREPARPSNRFDVSHREAEPPEPNVH